MWVYNFRQFYLRKCEFQNLKIEFDLKFITMCDNNWHSVAIVRRIVRNIFRYFHFISFVSASFCQYVIGITQLNFKMYLKNKNFE